MTNNKKIVKVQSDLGVSAYLLMNKFNLLGKKDKNFYFEINDNEENKFDELIVSYLLSEFHYFDHCLMGLKKLQDFNIKNNSNLFYSNLIITSNVLDNKIIDFKNIKNVNNYSFNSTIIDFISIITSNTYIINSFDYVNTHNCSYKKYIKDSELLIQVDFPYKINGFGTDSYSSRLFIETEYGTEYSIEHEQIFIGYASGGGTRSTTLSPINHKCDLYGSNVNIKVQIKLNDSDDSIITDKCIFIITEKKPSSTLSLVSYDTDNLPIGTSNRFIKDNTYDSPITTFTGTIKGSNLNIIGNTTSIINTNLYCCNNIEIKNNSHSSALLISQMNINHSLVEFYRNQKLEFIIDSNGNVGIDQNLPNFKLDINGSLNCQELHRNGISLNTTLTDYVTFDELMANEYVNFNNFRELVNSNVVGYNTTLIDFNSIITSNTFIVNSSNYINTHSCVYQKFFPDSELLIQAEFPYKINGFGSDHYASRLSITSEIIDIPEYSLEHEQIFIGYASGGGTRSTTLSPINHKTAIKGINVSINVQIKLIDSDDSLITDKCIFIITEKKPSSMLYFTSYINEKDIPRLTSNLYVSKKDFATTLTLYQTNNYGKWNCNNLNIYYTNGFVGIGKTNPNDTLDINGNLIATGQIISSFSDIRLKTITSSITNALDIISKINGFKYKPNEIAKSYGYNDDKELIGINAQEVSNLIPEIVSLAPFDIDIDNITGKIISKSGKNFLTLQYDKLIPYLIEAIKDLKKENDKLNNRLNKIENLLFK